MCGFTPSAQVNERRTACSVVETEQERLLQPVGDPSQELDSIRTIDESMIVGQRHR